MTQFPFPALRTSVKTIARISAILLISASCLSAEELDSTTDCNGNFVADIEELRKGRVMDCNLDGKPDICSLQPNDFGFLTPAQTLSSLASGLEKVSGLFADFNNDSRPDLATVEGISEKSSRFAVYFANEDYQYSLGYSLNLQDYAYIMLVEGTHGNDILIVNSTEDSARLLENNGSAGFTERPTFDFSHYPYFSTLQDARDLNGDGLGDLVVIGEQTLELSVRLNLGSGAFASPIVLYQEEEPLSDVLVSTPSGGELPRIVTGHYTGNGLYVVTSYRYNNGNFEKEGALQITASSQRLLSVANFAGTEQSDILLSRDINNLEIIIDADFTQSSVTPEAAGTGPCSSLIVSDLDEDGDADLFCRQSRYLDSETTRVYLRSLLNDGSGRFFLADLVLFYTDTREDNEYSGALALAQTTEDRALDVLVFWISKETLGLKTSIKRLLGATEYSFATDETDENRNLILDSCEEDGLAFGKFSLWNSYLEQINILELYNPGTSSTTVEVRLRDQAGAIAEQFRLNLAAGEKLDYVLNQLNTLVSPSYGVLEVKSSTEIGGGVTIYRKTPVSSLKGLGFDPGEYDYAYHLPLSIPHYGDAYFIYNCFQPSAFGADANAPVYEWLTLANLSSSSTEFEIETRQNLASATDTRSASLEPFQRIDLDGGHGLSTPLGIHKISTPLDAFPVPYLAFLTRYGATFDPERFSYAFPLVPAQPVTGSVELVSTGGGAISWLEIANLSEEEVGVQLHVEQDYGKGPEYGGVTLAPYEQLHVHAPSLIGIDRTRTVYSNLVNSTEGTYLIQGTSYFYSPKTGAIETAFATQRGSQINDTLYAGYNRFFGMFNWLRLESFAVSEQTRLSVLDSTGNLLSTHYLSGFPGSRIQEVGLHEGTVLDSYGLLRLELFSSSSVGYYEDCSSSDVLRIKTNPDSSLDFIIRERLR